jgi:2OG-Fe(II) oxygenase superfamily
VQSKVLEKLDNELGKIDRPGSFCASGNVPALLPGLEVEGLGPVGLPLTVKQAKDLIKLCDQAPYGKGEQTLVDTKVRRVWKLDPGHFSLTNPAWNRLVDTMVGKVQSELGLEKQKLESHLYDMLLYEPGSFFLPHRDGEKLDRMVATLVVVLPSDYEGGELIVRHDGQERTIDFQSGENSAFQIHFAAFYADCEHEVRPIRKGYRLALVYNLTLAKSKKAITAPRVSEHIDRIAALIREWAKEESAGKLAITLDHQYTAGGLTADSLKGADRAKAQVLFEAARQAGCRAYLALLTYHESGSAEYSGRRGRSSGSYRRSRYDEYDDGDPSDYEMGEIFDSELSAEHLSDSDGQGLPIGVLSVEEDELLDPDALTEIDPEVEFEGYTGNAGMTLDHWYRHATIFLWPEARHFEILCDQDSQLVVPVLKQMVSRWTRSKPKDASLKASCLQFADAIISRWTENRHRSYASEEQGGADLLKSLDELGDSNLIRRFLGEVMVKDVAVEPGKQLVTICQKYGWATFQTELQAVIKDTSNATMERNVRLLEQICVARPRKKEGWSELCTTLAQELVSTVKSVDQKPVVNAWNEPKVNRVEVLAGLARSLIASQQPELLSEFVEHALNASKKYPLIDAQIPALKELQPWLKPNLKKPSEGMTRWIASVREQLEALTAQSPREPNDYRRPSAVSCKCSSCGELRRFLENPNEAEHRFQAVQERRSHLEHQIRSDKLDLDLTTEKRGSPHTLVCRKNKASYKVKLATYDQNLKHLEAVRSIEAALPGS